MAKETFLPYLRHLIGRHRIFAILMLFSLALNIYLISVYPVQKIWGDEEEYIRLSHKEQSFGAKVKRIIPGFMYFEWWPPFAFGVYGLLADADTPPPAGSLLTMDDESQEPLESLGEYSGFFARVSVLNLFLFLITAFNIYWLCILLEFSRKTASIATGVFLFNPRVLFYVQALWPEFIHLAMLSCGMILLVLFDSRRRWLFLILSGIIFGFCSLTKGIIGFYLIVLLPFLAFREYKRSRKNALTALKVLAILYGCFLAVNLPQRIANYATHRTFSISTNLWINIESGFIPFQELRVDLHKRYFESSQDPFVREELSKRRVLDYIKSSSKLKIAANQVNRFVFKQLNRSFLLMGLKRERWSLGAASGYLSVILFNIAIMLSWFVLLFGVCGLIIHRSLHAKSAFISIYAVLYLLLVFLIVHNERFFIQVLPFLGIFAISFLMHARWRNGEALKTKKKSS